MMIWIIIGYIHSLHSSHCCCCCPPDDDDDDDASNGMNEYASVELSGIQNMWNLRQQFDDDHDSFLVQSFVGETRVLGVSVSSSTASTTMGGMEGMNISNNNPNHHLEDGDEDKDEIENGAAAAASGDEVEASGTLEEVVLPGLESNASTLYVGNVVGNLFLQITESQLRLANPTGELLDIFSIPPNDNNNITVAAANEAGQIVIALRGGRIIYWEVIQQKLCKIQERQLEKEVSCMNLNPFVANTAVDAMQVDSGRTAPKSSIVAVGLWDDFTVRILSLEIQLQELLQLHLSTEGEDEEEDGGPPRRNRNNMMARSLCLITLDFSTTHSSAHHASGGLASQGHNNASSSNLTTTSTSHNTPGVNMLFVGLGDGTLVSFAVVLPEDGEGSNLTVHSKKEVSLGTQRINLVPLRTERGGTCVLATGDRPTVIYLAGIGSAGNQYFNPKLCYSNVNLSCEDGSSSVPSGGGGGAEGEAAKGDVSRPAQQSIAVNVAAPFFSPLLLDTMGSDHYSLCVADDSNLRLGVIDDIQKLHVTTCRLGMAPRRIVHCPEGRLFAVGCIESGIKQVGIGGGELNMGNCIRFLDDTTFDDLER